MPKVFTVMPFSGPSAAVCDGILDGCRDAGFECVRVDRINQPGFIVTQIYDALNAADVIVGEMSDRNPNVFYEIGYTHAIGKPTILLAATSDDLRAFDTAGLRHHLHHGSAAEARRVVFEVLSDIKLETAVDPAPPDSSVLYEWPSGGIRRSFLGDPRNRNVIFR